MSALTINPASGCDGEIRATYQHTKDPTLGVARSLLANEELFSAPNVFFSAYLSTVSLSPSLALPCLNTINLYDADVGTKRLGHLYVRTTQPEVLM